MSFISDLFHCIPPLLPKLRNRLEFAIGNQQDLKQNGNSVPKQRAFSLSIFMIGVLLAEYGTHNDVGVGICLVLKPASHLMSK